jgi:predicted MPP superfamily phosphohydrolase
MSFFLAILIFMFVGDAVCWRLADRALAKLPRAAMWRSLNALFFLTQSGVLAAILFIRTRGITTDILGSKPLLSAVYIWHLVLLPLAVLIPVVAAIVAISRRITRSKSAPDGERIEITRRRFLALAAGGGPAIVCVGATAFGLRQIEEFRIRRLILPLAQLPPRLDGLTIAQVSDLHVGRFTNGAVLERIVTATNALNADLVLMTGDLINYEIRDLPLAIELTRRMQAAHGVFLCEGNHDLIEDGAQFVERVKRAGLRLLVNESTTLRIREADVQLLGLRWGGSAPAVNRADRYRDAGIESSMAELAMQRHEDVFPILLAHHPHAFDFAGGIPLTLGGHTHGGQLMLTENFGAGPAMFRYWSGLYRRADRALVVSNGVGNWLPLRTRAPAEIVHLTLRRA